jgi:long-chain acyl-CoA synthetase
MSNAQHPWTASYPVDIDWNAAIPSKTLIELFDESVAKNSKSTSLNFYGKKMTYQQLGDAVERFAKGLQDHGIGKGSKVGLSLPNTPFYVIAYYGALKAGATVVNFNPLYAEQEVKHQINDSGADIMVTLNMKEHFNKNEKMIGTTSLKKMITCKLTDVLPWHKSILFTIKDMIDGLTVKTPKDENHLAFKDLLKSKGAFQAVSILPEDVAVLQYTGGTTGVPKAAVLSHQNLATNVQQAALWFSGSDGSKTPPLAHEKVLTVLPFFHVFSMTAQMNMSLFRGSEIIMLPKFKVSEVLDIITKEKPTIFAGVPTMYRSMIDDKDYKKYDMSSLKICVSGGAGLPESLRHDFFKATKIELMEGYGLSETAPIAIANPVYGLKKVNSIGLPVPQTELKIFDLQFPDKECPVNVEGEICLRGPQVMQNYWNNPEETAHAIDKDGFFHTGDVGYMDEDGYTFIVDRIKDMIIVNGMKAFPRKIEDAILQHQDVSETIVVGVKDSLRGEVVKAYIVPKEGKTIDPDNMTAFLKDRLAAYEMPKQYTFRDELPKTMIGKPDRKALLAEEQAKESQSQPKPPKM